MTRSGQDGTDLLRFTDTRSESKLPRSLCAAMLLQFTVGGSVIPFISLILRDRGLQIQEISLIFSIGSATLLVVPFFWGMLADRYIALDRLFILLNVVGGGALLLFSSQREFSGIVITYLLFFVCFNPTLGLINALCFHHLPNPPKQFGFVRSWGSVGWILPFVPISLWMASHSKGAAAAAPYHMDIALYLGIACSFAMAGLSFFLPRTPPPARHKAAPLLARRAYGFALRELLRNRNFLILLGAMFLVAGSYSLLMYYSPPMLEDLGVPRAWIGPVQAIGVVCEIGLFQIQPAMIRRWGFTAIILLGCFCLLVRHLLFATVDNVWILSLSYPLAGAVIVFFHMGVSVMVNSMVGPEIRATAQTLLSLFGQGFGPMIFNWMAGHLPAYNRSHLKPIFWLAAALAALAAMLILSRGRKLDPEVAVA